MTDHSNTCNSITAGEQVVLFAVYARTLAAKITFIMVVLWNRADHYIFALWFLLLPFFMVALCNRADHYIFAL